MDAVDTEGMTLTELRKIWKWSGTRNGICLEAWKGTEGTSLRVPRFLDGLPVTAIGMSAFSPEAPRLKEEQRAARRNLRSVLLPETVSEIGIRAFQGCAALTEINLPSGLRELSSGVFEGCASLTQFTVPGHIRTICSFAFLRCGALSRVVLEDGVERMDQGCFQACGKLEKLIVPSSLTRVAEGALRGTALKRAGVEVRGGEIPPELDRELGRIEEMRALMDRLRAGMQN